MGHPSPARHEPLGRRLDRLPRALALGIGAATGLAAGLLLLLPAIGLPGWLAAPACLALLGGAVLLAHTGRPVVVPAPAPAPRPPEPAPPPPPPLEPEPRVDLVDIPAGEFLMGSADDDREARDTEKPQHRVAVAAFRLMRTPVTRRLYREIMGSDPGWLEGEADDRPVTRVTWYDAARFCNALSDKEGLTRCYRFEGARFIGRDPAGNGYRLPTEAEWEYACRAGTTTRYSFGDDAARLGDYAWFAGNSGDEPHPVGIKAANPWGLHDLHGNAWEWVEDCWHGSYAGAPADGSAWVSGECTGRVLRGGAFGVEPRLLRSAIRLRDEPVFRIEPEGWYGVIGFRCARAARRQP